MSPGTRDYSIFDKLNFERKPVGVKLTLKKPEGIERLDKELNFCEMFVEAQGRSPFYVTRGDFHCVEPLILGFVDPEPVLLSGMFGERIGAFEEARANRKLYQFLPKMLKGSVNYVTFSPIDQITFDPDVLICTANVKQAKVLLRARSHSSGDPWCSKSTFVVACAWIYLYPVLSGELNYIITGLGMGMTATKKLPEGLIIVSIPWNLLPMMMENMRNMTWEETISIEGEQRRGFNEGVEALKKELEEI